MKDKTTIEFLEQALKTYKERNKVYGDNYFKFGRLMIELFPNGLNLKTEADFNRIGGLTQIIAKISRYCNMFEQGGHKDSMHDLGVYAFIQQELDEKYKKDK